MFHTLSRAAGQQQSELAAHSTLQARVDCSLIEQGTDPPPMLRQSCHALTLAGTISIVRSAPPQNPVAIVRSAPAPPPPHTHLEEGCEQVCPSIQGVGQYPAHQHGLLGH